MTEPNIDPYSYRWRRAILVEIARGSLSEQAIDWYCEHYFGAVPKEWLLSGCAAAARYLEARRPSDAEAVYRKIITTQQEKANAVVQS
jgi:hypothetical protein